MAPSVPRVLVVQADSFLVQLQSVLYVHRRLVPAGSAGKQRPSCYLRIGRILFTDMSVQKMAP